MHEVQRAVFLPQQSIGIHADESVDWLGYLRDGRIKHDPALLQEATELAKILATAYRTSRRNNEGNASRT